MTRKRFVKLLMAEGYSRNEANKLARNARCAYSLVRIFTMKTSTVSSLCYPRRNYKFNFQPYLNMEGEYVLAQE